MCTKVQCTKQTILYPKCDFWEGLFIFEKLYELDIRGGPYILVLKVIELFADCCLNELFQHKFFLVVGGGF